MSVPLRANRVHDTETGPSQLGPELQVVQGAGGERDNVRDFGIASNPEELTKELQTAERLINSTVQEVCHIFSLSEEQLPELMENPVISQFFNILSILMDRTRSAKAAYETNRQSFNNMARVVYETHLFFLRIHNLILGAARQYIDQNEDVVLDIDPLTGKRIDTRPFLFLESISTRVQNEVSQFVNEKGLVGAYDDAGEIATIKQHQANAASIFLPRSNELEDLHGSLAEALDDTLDEAMAGDGSRNDQEVNNSVDNNEGVGGFSDINLDLASLDLDDEQEVAKFRLYILQLIDQYFKARIRHGHDQQQPSSIIINQLADQILDNVKSRKEQYHADTNLLLLVGSTCDYFLSEKDE